MKSSSQITLLLNKVLTYELTSINQFFLHARMYQNWGLEGLNKACYKKSIKDMKQADKLIERILFLEGLPNLQALGKLHIGEHSAEMLSCDLQFLMDQLPILQEAIAYAESEKDYVTRALLVEILEDEEAQIDWIETQQYQIDKVGIENYLLSKTEEDD